jgi:hypothetical protein
MGKKTNWCTMGLEGNPKIKGLKVFQNLHEGCFKRGKLALKY